MAPVYFIPIFIYFILPLTGLAVYIKLAMKMQWETDDPPYFSMFFLFYLYGGIFVMILTSLFWKVSGMVSILAFFLMLAGPVISIIIAVCNIKKKNDSIYHKWIFYSAVFYTVIFIGLLIISAIVSLF